MKSGVLVLLALFVTPCFAECPPTHAYAIHSNEPTIVTTASQLDTTVDTGGNQAGIRFDLGQGWVATYLTGLLGNAGLMVEPQDDFVIEGLPSGTPVSLTAKFRVLSVSPSGDHPPSYHALVGTGSSGDMTHVSQWLSENSIDAVVELPLDETAGQTFRLHYLFEYSNGLSGWPIPSANANWTFEGLPPGSSIASCHGYRQEAAVAAQPSSWGALKARYR
jgi:hypothetical protein